MVSATSTKLLEPKEIFDMFFKAIGDATKDAYKIIWDFSMSFLSENWRQVLLFLLVMLVVVYLEAIITGRWAKLGSTIYNYLKYAILCIVGLIFGPVVFAGNIWTIISVALVFPFCYWLTGKILRKLGFIK